MLRNHFRRHQFEVDDYSEPSLSQPYLGLYKSAKATRLPIKSTELAYL